MPAADGNHLGGHCDFGFTDGVLRDPEVAETSTAAWMKKLSTAKPRGALTERQPDHCGVTKARSASKQRNGMHHVERRMERRAQHAARAAAQPRFAPATGLRQKLQRVLSLRQKLAESVSVWRCQEAALLRHRRTCRR